ncbi:helix-turn-helix transcriptional regulator [Enterococcus gallinarum]|uniref:helix-turn-helix transcriptional regulator n=1 Tax=Enterococcus gallinarum TaxID=1353 RepID=UPI001C3D5A57|nr:helix-turn-helix transcriptional regulator [Enterococcus gallinarum]
MPDWLKKIREQHGYTQESFARRVGIAKTTYSSYEQGYRTPSVNTAKKMASVLGVPWTIFFDDDVLDTYYKKEATRC